MELNKIFYENEYEEAYKFVSQNENVIITEIDPDEKGRRFQIIDTPPLTEEQILENLREQREIECFSVINRGQLWYNTLSEEQIVELNAWYDAWLDITKTYEEVKPVDVSSIVPKRPEWLK